jgi:uncharacterized coiled-coil protein SlyX
LIKIEAMIDTKLQHRVVELEALLAEKDAKIAFLEEQFRLAQQKKLWCQH